LLAKASEASKVEAVKSEDALEANAAYSTKMIELLKRLRVDVSEGRRVVVFSQWTSFLDLIGPALDAAAIPWRRFDGSLSLDERRRRVEWLAEDAPGNSSGRVFMCSLRSGGVGLNLVAASRLYLLDLWWNPAVEEQAFQRVHRIGQTSEVHIYKFVVAESIDTDLLQLQRAKSQLLEHAMQDGTRREAASKLTLEDLKRLFRPCQSMKSRRSSSTTVVPSHKIDAVKTEEHPTMATATFDSNSDMKDASACWSSMPSDASACWSAMPCDDT
jgi:SNF2 family DNA or RNA helicase